MSTPEQATRISAKDIFAIIGRVLLTVVLAWNVYLFQYVLETHNALQEYKLYVAQNYTSKQDLEKMLGGFEKRFDKRFDQLFQLINK